MRASPLERFTPWTRIDGTEQVILGDLSILTEGDPVRIEPAPAAAKVAARTSARC